MALNLFPSRIPTGRATLPDGTIVDVLMTPEFSRALSDLLERVGGDAGLGTQDLALLLEQAQMDANPIPEADQEVLPPLQMQAVMAELAQLRQQVQVLTQAAQERDRVPSRISNYSVADLEQMAFANVSAPPSINWERPGRIGYKKPNSGAFTTLTSTRNAVFGNATQVTTSITNGTAGAAGAGAFSAVQNAGSFITAIGNKSALLGGAYDATATFYYTSSLLFTNAGTSQGQIFGGARWFFGAGPVDDGVSTVYSNGPMKGASTIQAVGGFGCNTKAPQAAAASGGAVATTAATNAVPYGYTTAAQANEIVTKLNVIQSALIANGIMS